MTNLQISRRDFLKLSASGALALALSEMGMDRALAAPPTSQGRITWSGIPLYDAPSFNAKELHLFGIDQVVNLIAEVDGEFTMKYFRKDGTKVWLEPANKKYKPIYPERSLNINAVLKAVIRKY